MGQSDWKLKVGGTTDLSDEEIDELISDIKGETSE